MKSQFIKLVEDEFRTNSRTFLSYLAVSLGIIAAIVFWYTLTQIDETEYLNSYDPVNSIESFLFIVGTSISGCMSAAMVFAPMKSKAESISFLMLPASQVDKYLSRWIIFVPLYTIVFWLGLEIIDLLRYFAVRGFYGSACKAQLFSVSIYGNWINIALMICSYVCLQSFFVLGSAIWPKKSAMRTFIALMILSLCSMIWSGIIGNLMLSPNMEYGPFLGIDFNSFDTFQIVWIVIFIIISIVNYVLAYYRFKEAEIIPRW